MSHKIISEKKMNKKIENKKLLNTKLNKEEYISTYSSPKIENRQKCHNSENVRIIDISEKKSETENKTNKKENLEEDDYKTIDVIFSKY